MPTTSSLLRSAEAARKKTIAYEDQVAAFNWENSAKTIDDYNKYGAYLKKRSETFMNADPSASLSYQTKLRTATRAYRSEEIQRASIDVLQGKGTLNDKYNRVYDLYQGALENGDLNSVQNLTQQLSSLDIQIQNEQERQQRFAEAAAATRTTDALKMADRILSGDNTLTINGQKVAPLTVLNKEFADNGKTTSGNYFSEARATIEIAAAKLQEALSLATTQEDYDRIAGKLSDLQSKGFSTPAGSLNYNDIIRAEMMQNAGNPLYVPAAGTFNSATQNQEYKMQKQKVDDIVWGRDQSGKYVPIETTAREGDSLDTVFNDKGQVIDQYQKDQFGQYKLDKNGNKIVNKDYKKFKDSGFTLKNMLEKQGLDAYQEGDSLYVRSPGGKLGDVGAVPVRIVVGTDGKIKYVREDSKGGIGFFEIDPLTGQAKEIAKPFDTAGYTTVGNTDPTKNKPNLFGIELLQKTLPGAGFDLLSKTGIQTGLDAILGQSTQKARTLEEMQKMGYVTPLAPNQVQSRAVTAPAPIITQAQQALTKATQPQQTAFSNVLDRYRVGGTTTAQQLQQQGYVTPLAPVVKPVPTPTPAPKPTPSVFNLANNAITPKLPF